MLHPVTFRGLAIAICVGLLACDAGALTLGPASGPVLVGRPLELAIPVTLDGREAGAPCLAADLSYGDRRVPAPALRWEPRGPGQGMLRVSSAQPVDEPALTLELRVGCGQPTTRHYVLLSELPPRGEASAPLVPAPALPPTAATPSASAATHAPAPPAAAPRAAAKAPATNAGVARAPSSRLTASAPPAPAAPARARLQLEPLDLANLPDPVLRLSPELRSTPATDPRQREAAAALWMALRKTPEEALQEALRLQAVQGEVTALRESTRRNTDAVARMRAQVEQARGERNVASGLVAVLTLLLAALAGWLGWTAWRAHRLARVRRWFDTNGETAAAGAPAPTAVPAVAPPQPGRAAEAPPAAAPAPEAGAPAPVSPATAAATPVAASAPGSGAPSQVTPSQWGDFVSSRGGVLRTVGVEELIDVHDQADFFLSIGAEEQAIALLEAHVHDQVDTGALAWMDLLELYHRLGRREEYERLRDEFREHFTAQVPEFDRFDQPSAPLENYNRALSRIVALWPGPRVLDVIEESIFRKPGQPGGDDFSLEAYRELVLLYHVARQLIPGAEAAARPLPARPAPPAAQALLSGAETAGEQEQLLIPPPSARLGLDIDLDEATADAAPGLAFDLPEPSPALVPPVAAGMQAPPLPPDAGTPAAPPPGGRELPPLDFDVSDFGAPATKPGPRD